MLVFKLPNYSTLFDLFFIYSPISQQPITNSQLLKKLSIFALVNPQNLQLPTSILTSLRYFLGKQFV